MTTISCGAFEREVSDFLDGAADPGRVAELALHKENCENCSSLYRDMVAISRALRRIRRLKAPADEIEKAMHGFGESRHAHLPHIGQGRSHYALTYADSVARQADCLEDLGELPFDVKVRACRDLIERGFAERASDVARGNQLLKKACEIAETLEGDGSDVHRKKRLQAEATACWANGLRIEGRFDEALRLFQAANAFMEEVSGPDQLRARILHLESSLWGAMRSFDRGHRLLEEALEIYQRSGEEDRVGGILIAQGGLLGEAGRYDKAVEKTRSGLERLGERCQDRDYLVGLHNLALFEFEAGRYLEALKLLPRVRDLHLALGHPVDLCRFRLLEGQIAVGRGEYEKAEEIFLEVHEDFIEWDLTFDAALVLLDLAVVFLKRGKDGELRQLSQDLVGVFASFGVSREAMGALVLFRESVEKETLTLEFARTLTRFLVISRSARTVGIDPER